MAEVVTGEAVVLDLAVARFPSRILALLIDVLVELPLVFFVALVVQVTAGPHLNGASAAAVFLSGLVLVFAGYPVIFETLSRGKTLGKMALGLRVVSDDGGPVRFRQALIRALALTFVELWIPPFTFIGLPAGLITSMVSAKGKRLGDMFAGTFVIQERTPRRAELAPAFTVIPAALAGWARHLELSRLSDQNAAAASSYLRRYGQLLPAARVQLGQQLAAAVSAQVSPAPPLGTPPEAFLAAVLAVRREREHAAMAARTAGQRPRQQPPAWAAAGSAGQGWAAPGTGTFVQTEPIDDAGLAGQPNPPTRPDTAPPAGQDPSPPARLDPSPQTRQDPSPPARQDTAGQTDDFGFVAPF